MTDNTSTSDAQTAQHPGSTRFNIEDRLAIINLCNTYAGRYDSNQVDAWLQLFTDNPQCTIRLADTEPVIVSGDDFRSLFRAMRASASDNGVQPLHYNTNLNVKAQTDSTALVETYMLYVPLDIPGLKVAEKTLTGTRITGTARYVFSLLKGDDGVWRINEYAISFDQLVVEATLNE